MFPDERLDLPELGTPEARTVVQPNGIEPHLGAAVIPLDMHMPRFLAVVRIEEEAVGARPQDCRHYTKSMGLRRGLASVPGCRLG